MNTMRVPLPSFRTTLSFLGLLCLPCGMLAAAGQVNRGTVHPTPENIPDATDPSLIIDMSDVDRWPEGPFVPDTSGMRTAVFGREDGEAYELLSWVRDIATDGHGSIFVLDADPRSDASSSFKAVHIIDADAQYLGSFGSAGEGPGEFLHPDHILVTDEGKRILIAGRERELDVFERQQTGVYRYLKSWDAHTGSSDACFIRGHVYLLYHDTESGHIIHKYTVDGEYVTGFGEPYKSSNPFVVQSLSDRGKLACIETHGVIGHTSHLLPVLSAYDAHGELLWRLKVEGLASIRQVVEGVTQDGRASMRFGQADRSKKGYGGLTVSPAYSDGHLYLGISISIGDDKRRALVFRVDALSGAFEHIGHGGIPHVAEKGLIARLLWKPESAPQVQIRSRE